MGGLETTVGRGDAIDMELDLIDYHNAREFKELV